MSDIAKLDPNMAVKEPESGLVWYDAEKLTIEGKGWTATKEPFHRLPAKAEGVVPSAVWDLGCHSAGISVRFSTDAASLSVEWSGGGAMDHMPATGVSGLDLYLRHENVWRYVATGRPDVAKTRRSLLSFSERAEREFVLNLSLYNTVHFLKIGVPEGSSLTPAKPRTAKPIVFYGTSIMQGGCASRPGMACPSIVSRAMDLPTINLGFSGNGKMDFETVSLISELDAAAFVVDCLPNIGKVSELAERCEPALRKLLSAHPATSILLVDEPFYSNTIVDKRHFDEIVEKSAFQRKIGRKLAKEGAKIGFLGWKASDVAQVEATVDCVHQTDLGFALSSPYYVKALEKLLAKG